MRLIGIAISVILVLMLLWPPELMPAYIYRLTYGWRYPKSKHCGDVVIIDTGPGAAIGRYIVNIDEVEFRDSSQSWNICGLPNERFYAGVEVPLGERGTLDQRANLFGDVLLSIELFSSDGNTVFHGNGSMSDEWIWSGPYGSNMSFVYKETYFDAAEDEQYKLHLGAHCSNCSELPSMRIVIKGGGWK